MAAPAASADELAGLWKAKRRFGPDARGLLVIQRTDATYSAEMVGRIVPVRIEKGELSFDLPNGEGAFRGRLQAGGAIVGYWFPPSSMAQNAGGKFASPVRLKSDGPNRWSGQVVPFEAAFTFYLLAQKRPDGTLGVFLRNPERDFGAWLGVDRMVRDGNAVKLIGKQKEEREAASGTYDADNGVISLSFPSRRHLHRQLQQQRHHQHLPQPPSQVHPAGRAGTGRRQERAGDSTRGLHHPVRPLAGLGAGFRSALAGNLTEPRGWIALRSATTRIVTSWRPCS